MTAELEKFNLECLERVNELRRQLKVPPLRLRLSLIHSPSQISAYYGAQDWAQCLACTDLLQSDPDAANNDIGETICRLFSEKFSAFCGRAVINAWFDEAIECKNHSSAEKASQPVNFLQLIWSNTRYCGFGFAVSEASSAMYAVARFKPNLPGKSDGLAAGYNQQVLKFDSANGSMAFKNTICNNLSLDVSYVKRNLYCTAPKTVVSQADPLQTQHGRYRLSHLVRQTRFANRVGRHRMGLVYNREPVENNSDTILVMLNEE